MAAAGPSAERAAVQARQVELGLRANPAAPSSDDARLALDVGYLGLETATEAAAMAKLGLSIGTGLEKEVAALKSALAAAERRARELAARLDADIAQLASCQAAAEAKAAAL